MTLRLLPFPDPQGSGFVRRPWIRCGQVGNRMLAETQAKPRDLVAEQRIRDARMAVGFPADGIPVTPPEGVLVTGRR